MLIIERAYYHGACQCFLTTSDEEILGRLCLKSEFDVDQLQRNAWIAECEILRSALQGLTEYLLLEYSIPRMNVEEISRSEAGTKNLTKTAEAI